MKKIIMSLILIFFIPTVFLYAEEFTSADHENFKLMTKTLEKWYQLNQLGLPKSENDLKNIINMLLYIRDESAKVSDTFLHKFNQKNSSMLCIGVKKIKIHFDTSQLCGGVIHFHLPDPFMPIMTRSM